VLGGAGTLPHPQTAAGHARGRSRTTMWPTRP